MTETTHSRRAFLKSTTVAAAATLTRNAGAAETPPNIVYILADDMGYGDVSALNPKGKIKTPHLDALAAKGKIFTDAHSSSSVCTPTRYGVLTGRYNWRSRLKNGVLWGYSQRLIEPGRATVASMLQDKGYHTACVGKWHLGMNWSLKEGGIAEGSTMQNGRELSKHIDFTKRVAEGPNAVGFDYFFGISASLDMRPYVYIENDVPIYSKIVEKGFNRLGAADVDFEAVDVLPRITHRAGEYIKSRAATGEPFFLYFPLNAPHTPILPTPEWQGKSGLSNYGDFTLQVDASVGHVMAALEEAGVAENTLVIFTADNGCSNAANIPEMQAKGHEPNYVFRGHKADIFDGGHRIPFIASWPARIEAGTQSDQLCCLTDLMATCAEIVGETLPDNAGEDSVSILPALLGTDTAPIREAVVHHSIDGAFAIRQGKWKLALCPSSGGWSAPRPGDASKDLPPVQLYDMKADISEQNNLQADHPEVVAHLTALLEDYVARGRSTPGAPQQNTTPVDIMKAAR